MNRRIFVAGGVVLLASLAVALLRAPRRGGERLPSAESAAGGSVEPSVALALPRERSGVELVDGEREPGQREESAPAEREGGARERVTVRGHVIDARTGAPVPAWLRLGVSISTDGGKGSFLGPIFGRRALSLGPAGSFAIETRQPERLAARVVEWSERAELEEEAVHRYADERAPDGTWRLLLDVGWLARLELVGPSATPLTLRAAGLIEVVAGEERECGGADVLGREGSLVAWRRAPFEEDPAHARWLLVAAADESGRRFGARVPVPALNGIQPAPIAVTLAAATSARGRVLDEHGEPWPGAVVELLPAVDSPLPLDANRLWTECDPSGAFEFGGRTSGEHRLCVSAAFTRGSRVSVWLHPGDNDLGAVLLPRGGARGKVSGLLRDGLLRDGPSDADDEPSDDPEALVILRDPRTGLELTGITGFDLFRGPEDGDAAFEFPEVLAGRYELEIVALDGRSYPDSPYAVEAPASGLVIEAAPERSAAWRLLLLDARSGARLEPDEVLHFRAGRWVPSFTAQDSVLLGFTGQPLVVTAEQHRPVRLDAPLAGGGSGAELKVALEPGWGRVVLFRDLGAGPPALADDVGAFFLPPLTGVRVIADGREVACSDATGLALVGLEREPAKIAFERAGYRTLSTSTDESMQLVLMAPE